MANLKNSKTQNVPPNVSEEEAVDQDWEFEAILPKVKNEEDHKNSEPQVKKTHIIGRRQQSLALDQSAVPRTKTRSAMALEIQEAEEDALKDEYSFAPLPKRAIAFVLDTIWLAAILFVVKFSSPLLRKLIQYFMDNYKLKFMISEPIVMNGIVGISGSLALFFLIVIPVAFFNTSLGKKILGLRVRGNGKYTLSISQAFKRELIMKPLSIVILAGFITPFISKKHLSIHDMLSDTLVIED
ncbi:MAG: RDD family protein [Bacteriovorax sp.]|nr:RDD family protein [Bacteriovorax sp.]